MLNWQHCSCVWIMRGRGPAAARRRLRRAGDAGDGGEGGTGDVSRGSEACEAGDGDRDAGGGDGELRSQSRGVGDCSVFNFRRLLYFRGPVCGCLLSAVFASQCCMRCCTSSALECRVRPHTTQQYAGPPLARRSGAEWCERTCSRSTTRWLKARGHTAHAYGFSPVCILSCFRRVPPSAKAFQQNRHAYGRSPVWIRM